MLSLIHLILLNFYFLKIDMPNKKNALKALRQTKKHTLERSRVKSQLDTLLKNIRKSLAAQKIENANELLRSLQQSLDKASKKYIISTNRANRLKSRLTKKLKTFRQTPEPSRRKNAKIHPSIPSRPQAESGRCRF